MSYFTPGGSNLTGNPHAPRMGETQRKEFLSHISTERTPPAWMVVEEEEKQIEAEEQVIEEEWEAQQKELQDEYPILMKYLERRKFETEKERAEAEAEYVAEYHAWVLEMARVELTVRVERLQQILAGA